MRVILQRTVTSDKWRVTSGQNWAIESVSHRIIEEPDLAGAKAFDGPMGQSPNLSLVTCHSSLVTCHLSLLFSGHVHPAVDVEHMASDVAGFLRGQEPDPSGHVAVSPHAAERDQAQDPLPHGFGQF